MSEADTKPTLETISKQMEEMHSEVRAGFVSLGERLSSIERRLDIIESQLVQMDARLDGIAGFAHQNRSEVLGLRKDFKEFRAQFKEPA